MRKSKFVRPLTVALTNDSYENVKECSDREEVSMAEVVRIVLEKFFINNSSLKKATDEFAKTLSR
ncbi:hypothetical protein KAI46_03290 [bacterium]|nr:hypothetical protein [bacterium]